METSKPPTPPKQTSKNQTNNETDPTSSLFPPQPKQKILNHATTRHLKRKLFTTLENASNSEFQSNQHKFSQKTLTKQVNAQIELNKNYSGKSSFTKENKKLEPLLH